MSLLEETPVYCVGLNHRTAPVNLLEQVTICRDQLVTQASKEIARLSLDGHPEIVLLSTCNRFELYWAYTPRKGRGELLSGDQMDSVVSLFATIAGEPRGAAGVVYRYGGKAACRHLFRVASGLDSAVLGESEIQGQVSIAFSAAQSAKTAGPVLTELFQSALRCGKRARLHTAVGRNAASVSSVAVQLAGRIVGDLSDVCAVVVGAGQTGELTLKALAQRGLREIHVVNRTIENAIRVAAQWGGTAHAFSSLDELIPRADIIITAVNMPEPLLTRTILEKIMASRKERPLVIIDIAVPRNVAADVSSVSNVHLFDVDAIKMTVEENARERAREVPLVEQIIEEELSDIGSRMGELLVRPVLSGLWRRAERIRADVLEQARRNVPEMADEQWHSVERLALSLMKRLLHTPARKLRDEAGDEYTSAAAHAAALEYLFDLDESR